MQYSVYKNKKTKEYIYYPDFFELTSIKRRSIRIRQKILFNSKLASKFITLTYDDVHLHSEYKNDINLFIKRLKYYLAKNREIEYSGINKNLEYCWKFETNSIGKREFNPHFHLITNIITFLPQELIQETWGKGFIHVNQIENKKELVKYVSKYMSKDTTLEFESAKIRDWRLCVECDSNVFSDDMKYLGCEHPPSECLITRKKSFSSSRGYLKPKSDFRFIGNMELDKAIKHCLKMNANIGTIGPKRWV